MFMAKYAELLSQPAADWADGVRSGGINRLERERERETGITEIIVIQV